MSATSAIIPAIDQLEIQNSQMFPFVNVEQFLGETRTSEICIQLDVSADLINRYRADGLTVIEADTVACKLHEHVSSIWPEWFNIHHIPDDVMDQVEAFMEVHKKCGKCGVWSVKDGGFYRRTQSADGFAPFCKKCTKLYDVRRRERDRVAGV